MIEIIEERVFNGHCQAINDAEYPWLKGTGEYPLDWTWYIDIVRNAREKEEFPDTPSYYVPDYYFELYRDLLKSMELM